MCYSGTDLAEQAAPRSPLGLVRNALYKRIIAQLRFMRLLYTQKQLSRFLQGKVAGGFI